MDNSRTDFFRRHQGDNIYRYTKVYGGPGKTKEGYQEVLNFLNPEPIISIERNYISDASGLTGTWCNYEVAEQISEQEYNEAFKRATAGHFQVY